MKPKKNFKNLCNISSPKSALHWVFLLKTHVGQQETSPCLWPLVRFPHSGTGLFVSFYEDDIFTFWDIVQYYPLVTPISFHKKLVASRDQAIQNKANKATQSQTIPRKVKKSNTNKSKLQNSSISIRSMHHYRRKSNFPLRFSKLETASRIEIG